MRGWARRCGWREMGISLAVIVAGTAIYGAALGAWRSPAQGVFSALKLPLVLTLTALGNSLINGMAAPLLGVSISFKESLAAILASFAICATILASLAPLLLFLVVSSPSMDSAQRGAAHGLILIVNVGSLALAGIVGNVRLFQTILSLSGDRPPALRVWTAWLGMNLLLGSQFSWLLRPFVGSPGLPVEFLRADAFQGNFFEAVFRALVRLFS